MTITLLLLLISAALMAVAIIEARELRIHSLMNNNVTRLMRHLHHGEA